MLLALRGGGGGATKQCCSLHNLEVIFVLLPMIVGVEQCCEFSTFLRRIKNAAKLKNAIDFEPSQIKKCHKFQSTASVPFSPTFVPLFPSAFLPLC